MIQWVLSQVFSLLGGPFAKAAIDAYKAKLTAEGSTERIAADLASRELEVQSQVRIAEIGRWYEPDKIMGYTIAFLLAKIVVWDTAMGLGTTDLHPGWLTTTAQLIVGFYFGQNTVVTASRVLTRFLKK